MKPLGAAADDGGILRHATLGAAALAAALFSDGFQVQSTYLWALHAEIAINVAVLMGLVSRHRDRARILSPWISVAAWSVLIAASGGAGHSPFVAGLGFELLVAVKVRSRVGLRTLASVLGLELQEFLLVADPAPIAAAVQGALLVAVGLVLRAEVSRLEREHETLSRGVADQAVRLAKLERELDDTRRVASLGESAGRFMHGVKNALHGIRGLAKLLEANLEAGRGAVELSMLLSDLQQAIDGLHELSRQGLAPRREAQTAELSGDVRCSIEQVLRRLAPARECAATSVSKRCQATSRWIRRPCAISPRTSSSTPPRPWTVKVTCGSRAAVRTASGDCASRMPGGESPWELAPSSSTPE
jgi:hypothetical protein